MQSKTRERSLKVFRHLAIPLVLLVAPVALVAQSSDAAITGHVDDPSKASIPGAAITAINTQTGVRTSSTTNSDGLYVVTGLIPGTYRVEVDKAGFKSVIEAGLTLHVQDNVQLNFDMAVGSQSESVSVTASGININTTDATVSTVVDRNFVQNMPLNGRSFQSLILLTPGVATVSPQATSKTFGASGEFSVNGQRTESNYYTVDGVSANVGSAPGVNEPSISGALPGATALGTTQALVSVDALEEFRVQSSTYSAEYGRSPGGQFSFVTRSGTNDWHGSLFDYLRNNDLDANDWFNNYLGVPQAALRQNDFGGTLGGPVEIPHLYNGKDKTFFFFSYEGLRLVQPQEAIASYVPSISLRQNPALPSVLRPFLNAFPIPNGPDLGNGLAEFLGAWSNPSAADAFSARVDEQINPKLRLFFRFGDTPSSSLSRQVTATSANFSPVTTIASTQTYTIGATSPLSSQVVNEARFNYSQNRVASQYALDNLGGATPINLAQSLGFDATHLSAYLAGFNLGFSGYPTLKLDAQSNGSIQRQWNLTDGLTVSRGRHHLKFGVDYRAIMPEIQQFNTYAFAQYSNEATLLANAASVAGVVVEKNVNPVFRNFSAFAQDDWQLMPRLSLSLGLRWDVNPAMSAPAGQLPYAVRGSSPNTYTLAPEGTALYATTWHNFAPRLGAAYVLRSTPGFETVLRAGGGVFYDTGQQDDMYGYLGPGFNVAKPYSAAALPFTAAQLNVPIPNPPTAPFSTVYMMAPHLQLPYTLQWSSAIEQALGKSQGLTVSYVGAAGRKLLEEINTNSEPFNPNFGFVDVFQNGLTSSYNALQVRFQRRFSRGLQALASYTWSHCIDYGSQNISIIGETPQRGDCDFDFRDSFSAAVSYEPPTTFRGVTGAFLNHWGLDTRVTARSAFSVPLFGNTYTDPTTGIQAYTGLNLIPGVPVYLYGSQYPGGKEINPAAFSAPATGTFGNAPRNVIRGFDETQVDLALRREFPVYERLKLQFRAEAFNLLNHPNFGTINTTYCNGTPRCTFGQATTMLNSSLGQLSSLYQAGGPRSMQFSLRLAF